MSTSDFPDYYQILGIPRTATTEDVKQAYKKESLRTHPDRLNHKASVDERKRATEKFQAVADAYYVLSNETRRKEYDSLYRTRKSNSSSNDSDSASWFWSNFSSQFGGPGASPGPRPNADGVFADVFEELLRPEFESRSKFWSYLGAVSGGSLGFIIANVPGLLVGGYAGNRVGAIRDAKGKSVAAVFNDLGSDQKAEVLKALAVKILGSAFA